LALNYKKAIKRKVTMVENPMLRINLAKEGQKRVLEDFSLNQMVANLESFLMESIAEDSN
jgi:hypothetical protein